MTGAEIKEFVDELTDDSMSETIFLNILNSEKDIWEGQKLWQFLKKLDSSRVATLGNNYNTGITLPDDFRSDYKVFVGEDLEFHPVEFEQQHVYRNISHKYVVDIANNVYKLLGNIGRPDSIYFYYIKTTPEITMSTSPVWPERYHRILAYRVAARYMAGVDVDDIFISLSRENRLAAMELQDAMIIWDTQLKNKSRSNRLRYTDDAGVDEDVILGNM